MPNDMFHRYRIKISPATYLHIGCGELLDPTQYVIQNNKMYILNQSRLVSYLRAKDANALNSAMTLTHDKIARFIADNFNPMAKDTWIQCHPVDDNMQQRYVRDMDNPSAQQLVSAFIYNHLTGNPYLPGSSIKGAIRTALLAKRLVNPTERIDKLANGIISDRDLEPKIFRYLNNWRKPDITNDPFKFLKVSDIEFPADYLTLRVVENAKKSPNEERKHTPQELEYLCQAVRKGSDPLIGIIQIHKCWQDDNPMLQIVAACSAFFKTKLNEDKIFYTAHNPALHKILCELPDKCAANECFLRLGKATGIVHKSINPQQPQTRSLIGGMPMGICKLSFEELI